MIMTIVQSKKYLHPEAFAQIKIDLLQYFKKQYLDRPRARIIYFNPRNVVNEFLSLQKEIIDSELTLRLQGAFSYELRSFFRDGAIRRFGRHTFYIDLHTFPHQVFTQLFH